MNSYGKHHYIIDFAKLPFFFDIVKKKNGGTGAFAFNYFIHIDKLMQTALT